MTRPDVIWKTHYLLPRLLTLAVLTVLPLVVLHAYTLHAQYHRAQAATYRAVLGHVDLAAGTVDDTLAQVESQLRLVAHRCHAQRGDPLRCASLLQTLAQESRLVVRFDVHTATGVPTCSSDATGTEDAPISAAWAARALSQHGLWLSDPFVVTRQDTTQRTHVVRLALAMDGPPGHGPELYSALVSLQQVSELLSPAALPSGSVLSLYDTRGLILARNPGFEQWIGKPMPVAAGDASSWATTVSTAVGVDGVERLYARSRLRRPGLQISAGVPTAGVTAPLVEEAWRAALIGLLVLGAGMAMAAYWSRIVGRSLQRLTRAAADLGSGQEGARIDDKLPGELGALASQFNLMLQALQARNQALQASQHRAVQLARLNEALSEAAHAAARIREPRSSWSGSAASVWTPDRPAWPGSASTASRRPLRQATRARTPRCCSRPWWMSTAEPAWERAGTSAAPAARWWWRTTSPRQRSARTSGPCCWRAASTRPRRCRSSSAGTTRAT